MLKISFKNDKFLGPALLAAADKEKAAGLNRFFKTGPGQYGEGDIFLGLTVPTTRSLLRRYQDASFALVEELLASPYHEARLLGLLIIVRRYERADSEKERAALVKFYLVHHHAANNWDLVDLSVYKVWGDYLLRHPEKRKDLYRFARSHNLWERRLAVVATMALIKAGEFKEILELSRLLLKDKEDLIQKAVGWMLREVGKRNEPVLRAFLDEYAGRLPRVTLRYALERLSEKDRQKYLRLTV